MRIPFENGNGKYFASSLTHILFVSKDSDYAGANFDKFPGGTVTGRNFSKFARNHYISKQKRMWVKDETKDLSMVPFSRTVDAAVTTLHGIHVPTFGWVQRNFCYSQCKHKGILWKNYFQCTEKVDGYPLDFVIRGDVCPNGFYEQKKRSQSDQCTVAISNIAIFQNLDIFGVVSFH